MSAWSPPAPPSAPRPARPSASPSTSGSATRASCPSHSGLRSETAPRVRAGSLRAPAPAGLTLTPPRPVLPIGVCGLLRRFQSIARLTGADSSPEYAPCRGGLARAWDHALCVALAHAARSAGADGPGEAEEALPLRDGARVHVCPARAAAMASAYFNGAPSACLPRKRAAHPSHAPRMYPVCALCPYAGTAVCGGAGEEEDGSLPDAVARTLQWAPRDLRRPLARRVVLAGGGAVFPGALPLAPLAATGRPPLYPLAHIYAPMLSPCRPGLRPCPLAARPGAGAGPALCRTRACSRRGVGGGGSSPPAGTCVGGGRVCLAGRAAGGTAVHAGAGGRRAAGLPGGRGRAPDPRAGGRSRARGGPGSSCGGGGAVGVCITGHGPQGGGAAAAPSVQRWGQPQLGRQPFPALVGGPWLCV